MTITLHNQVPVSFKYKISVCGAQKNTLRPSPQVNQIKLLHEMISTPCENRTEEIQAVGVYKAEFIHVTTGGTHSYHGTLNFFWCS
jgi:hypothetical protein